MGYLVGFIVLVFFVGYLNRIVEALTYNSEEAQAYREAITEGNPARMVEYRAALNKVQSRTFTWLVVGLLVFFAGCATVFGRS